MLSDKINSLPISQTVGMTAKAHDLKNKGVDVITLSAGEPDFNIPDYIKDAAIDAINNNFHKYSPVDGFLELKKAISINNELGVTLVAQIIEFTGKTS